MTVLNFFQKVNDAYRGTDDDPPVIGTTDGDYWLRVTNRFIGDWAKDEKIDWKSNFATRSLGTIIAGTQSYSAPSDLLNPANCLIVTLTNGTTRKFDFIDPSERQDTNLWRAVYLTGDIGSQLLNFVDTITSTSDIVGGTMSLDGYFLPAELTQATDVLPVDDPEWLIFAVAGELAFNELTYEDKAPDLVAKANDRYGQMAENNRRGTHNNPRVLRTRVDRIRGSWR